MTLSSYTIDGITKAKNDFANYTAEFEITSDTLTQFVYSVDDRLDRIARFCVVASATYIENLRWGFTANMPTTEACCANYGWAGKNYGEEISLNVVPDWDEDDDDITPLLIYRKAS